MLRKPLVSSPEADVAGSAGGEPSPVREALGRHAAACAPSPSARHHHDGSTGCEPRPAMSTPSSCRLMDRAAGTVKCCPADGPRFLLPSLRSRGRWHRTRLLAAGGLHGATAILRLAVGECHCGVIPGGRDPAPSSGGLRPPSPAVARGSAGISGRAARAGEPASPAELVRRPGGLGSRAATRGARGPSGHTSLQ